MGPGTRPSDVFICEAVNSQIARNMKIATNGIISCLKLSWRSISEDQFLRAVGICAIFWFRCECFLGGQVI